MEASEFLGPGAPNPTLRSLEFLRASEFQAKLVNVSRSQKFPLQFQSVKASGQRQDDDYDEDGADNLVTAHIPHARL